MSSLRCSTPASSRCVIFGLRVREFPTARRSAAALAADPRGRADDVNAAFADPDVAMIVASIGGDDSARLLEFLDFDLIARHPKILMGYSDTTTQTFVLNQRLGLVTFTGPAVMAGFAQMRHFPQLEAHVRGVLFDPTARLEYRPYARWIDEYRDWAETDDPTAIGEIHVHEGWRWVNGDAAASGRLTGGCIEVLEFLKGTAYWPTADWWSGRILFLETSEEVPTVEAVRGWLFNYRLQGVFGRLSGLVFGRARGYTAEMKDELDDMIRATVVDMFEATQLPIVTDVDFGHTDPQWILPLGVLAELDPGAGTFRLLEPAVT